jgi:hypothetical protein
MDRPKDQFSQLTPMEFHSLVPLNRSFQKHKMGLKRSGKSSTRDIEEKMLWEADNPLDLGTRSKL